MILNLPIKANLYIDLKFSGPRISKVFHENKGNSYNSYCPNTTTFPNVTYINGYIQENKSFEYYLNDTENTIRLEYENYFDLECYFYLCSNITEIDFGNFSTLQKGSLASLFYVSLYI